MVFVGLLGDNPVTYEPLFSLNGADLMNKPTESQYQIPSTTSLNIDAVFKTAVSWLILLLVI